MEIFAEENHVPIIKEAERAIFRGIMAKYQPKHILEIGTAIGYSALLMAHCGQGAKIKTLELSEERARTAQSTRGSYGKSRKTCSGFWRQIQNH